MGLLRAHYRPADIWEVAGSSGILAHLSAAASNFINAKAS
jgi:hypothetical protein